MIMKENNSHSVESIPYSIRNAIKRTADKNEKYSGTKYKKLNQRIHDWFNNNLWITPKALFYLIKNNLSELPFCEYCKDTQLTPKQYELSYKNEHFFCCAEHASKSEITREKINKTWELNGGVPFKRKDVIDKRRNTWQEKYGGNNPISDPAILEKFKNTCIERYGVDNPSKSKLIQNKVRNTLIEHYGVDTPIKNPEIEKKRRNTWLEKYGVEHPCKTEEVRERQKQTWMEHYGVDHMSKADAIRKVISENHRINLWESRLNIAEDRNFEILSTKEAYINKEEWIYKCKTCGNIITTSKGPAEVRCYTCHPVHEFVSNKERSVAEWVRSIYSGTVITSDRSMIAPYELDIYIPERNLAIEFDGAYWHSERFKERDYHQKKSLLCMNKGIRLIHIPELIWEYKRDIIKSIIENALGVYKYRVFARNCTIRTIGSSQYRNFLDENHIQGAIVSKQRYGLYYNTELVAVLGYGSSRFAKGELELHRFCIKKEWNIPGAFSKLLKHSKFHGSSYIDLNYFNGAGYLKSGFKFIRNTEPSYVWLKPETGQVYSRYQTQKHKLEKLLEYFDPELSETQNMELHGFEKVYDAGNMKVEI